MQEQQLKFFRHDGNAISQDAETPTTCRDVAGIPNMENLTNGNSNLMKSPVQNHHTQEGINPDNFNSQKMMKGIDHGVNPSGHSSGPIGVCGQYGFTVYVMKWDHLVGYEDKIDQCHDESVSEDRNDVNYDHNEEVENQIFGVGKVVGASNCLVVIVMIICVHPSIFS